MPDQSHRPWAMTLEEARRIVSECDYCDLEFADEDKVTLDGHYNIEDLEALVMVMRAAQQPDSTS